VDQDLISDNLLSLRVSGFLIGILKDFNSHVVTASSVRAAGMLQAYENNSLCANGFIL